MHTHMGHVQYSSIRAGLLRFIQEFFIYSQQVLDSVEMMFPINCLVYSVDYLYLNNNKDQSG